MRSEHTEQQQVEVLFVSLSDPDSPDVAALIEETETQILEGGYVPVHFTLEHIDPSLVGGDLTRKKSALKFLREKYRTQTFDLVIAIGHQTLEFLDQLPGKGVPDAALLFYAADPENGTKWLKRSPGRSGIIRKLNFLPTLHVALQQNPGTNEVIVVAGSSDFEKFEVNVAHAQFASYEPNLEFQYWTNLKFSELKSRLAKADPKSVILFLDFLADANGKRFIPSRILPALSATSNRPIYGTLSSFVGSGIVGGSVADMREIGRALGQDGARILSGEKPENIRIETGEFQHYAFDWRQLRRWGIPDSQLPPESVLLHKEFSPWQVYRGRILALSGAVAIETLLILLLLHMHSRRRQAEQALKRKDAELSEAQRLAELGSWQWNPKTGAVTLSNTLRNLLDLDLSLPAPLNCLSKFFTAESWEVLMQGLEQALQTGETYEQELEARGAEGARLWLAVRGEAARGQDGSIHQLRGTMQNISERKRAEEARLKHAAIVESSDDAIISKKLDGVITSWNSGAQRVFGFSEAEAVGKNIRFIIPAELQEEENMILRQIRAGNRIEHYETRRVGKNGKKIDISLTVYPVKDSKGRIIGATKIARDITEHKQREEELKKSEEKFSKAFRQGPMSISLTSVKTPRYLDINETFERLTGFRREELIGRNVADVGLWIEPSLREGFLNRLLAEGNLRGAEFKIRRKDGEIRVAEASAELIEVGGELCVLAAAVDITDRKQTEQALLESEKRFRLMADSAPVLMWLSGSDRLFTDFNREWLRFTGRTMQQEPGEGWTHRVHPDDLQNCLCTYMEAFEEKRSFAREFRLRRYDGEYRWMHDRGVPRFLENGCFAGYIGCCFDITDQKEARAARAELSGRLIQAQEEERGRIARELHDDISQRLALLANGLQELEQLSTEEADELYKKELGELWQLTCETANDIQNLSHQLHPSKLQYLGLASAASEHCREFSKQYKIDVGCTIRELPDLDESVSLNLFRTLQESLRNIAKHSGAHHVKVELTGESGFVRLCISDDGVGFNPDGPRNGGLGLVSMQERLRSVGGDFSIWSRPSLGTQVQATVPAARFSRVA